MSFLNLCDDTLVNICCRLQWSVLMRFRQVCTDTHRLSYHRDVQWSCLKRNCVHAPTFHMWNYHLGPIVKPQIARLFAISEDKLTFLGNRTPISLASRNILLQRYGSSDSAYQRRHIFRSTRDCKQSQRQQAIVKLIDRDIVTNDLRICNRLNKR